MPQLPGSNGTITLVVPTAPGVSGDQLARIVAEALSRILEIPVRVENVGGDSGVAGTNAIAAAPRDGTVLGLGISSAMIGGRLLSRNAKFNPIEDFQWFTILGTYPAAMVVPANAPQRDIAAWIASARETPMPLTYASVGTGSAGHLAGGFLRMAQGARLIHRSVESPDERYALLADGKIAALFDDVPNARIAAPALRAPDHRRDVGRAHARCLPTCPRSVSSGSSRSTRGSASSGRRGSTIPSIYGSPRPSGCCVGDSAFLDSMRGAGVSFMGLGGRGALAFLDSEILRSAKQIAQLSEEGMR